VAPRRSAHELLSPRRRSTKPGARHARGPVSEYDQTASVASVLAGDTAADTSATNEPLVAIVASLWTSGHHLVRWATAARPMRTTSYIANTTPLMIREGRARPNAQRVEIERRQAVVGRQSQPQATGVVGKPAFNPSTRSGQTELPAVAGSGSAGSPVHSRPCAGGPRRPGGTYLPS
jgi:hypothetical protein